MTETSATLAAPEITRVRHELKRRMLTVASSERITPNMLRIAFTGEDLADFVSAAPDDHVKLFVPDGDGEPARRDYTPRRYDAAARSLLVDFALHDAGPATQWALNAQPGDTLEIGGPRGSRVISGDIAHWLLIADETGLPAVGRRLEEAPAGTPITTLVAVPGAADEQVFETAAEHDPLWLHRDPANAADPAPFLEKLESISLPPATFVWIAAEGSVTRAIRSYLLEERGHPLTWLKASGYWVMGKADATEKFD